jgi:ribosomal protein S18
LTREEILDPKLEKLTASIPLNQDPFFQYIKTNRAAREILIPANALFSPEKIVSLALRQDIGVDKSAATIPKNIIKGDNLSWVENFNLENTPDIRREKERPEHYFSLANADGVERDFLNDKPNTIKVRQPITKNRVYENDTEPINEHDLHWRNSALLCQFINSCSFIQNKVQNRLPIAQQKKVKSVIKHARQLKLLPTKSFVRPWHRQSLKTLEEDITWAGVKKVDLESGAMLIIDNEEMDQDFDWSSVDGGEEFQAEWEILKNFNES